MSTRSNKVRIYPIAQETLMDILKGKAVVDLAALPADAEIVNVGHIWGTRCFQLLVHSKEFDEVSFNVLPPTMLDVVVYAVNEQ